MTKEKNECVPRLRFPEFVGQQWSKILLENIAMPIIEKGNKSSHYTILTLSCDHGLVIQDTYFGKKIAGSNYARYIKIKKNDFVYNDRTTSIYPYGTIKRLTLDVIGLVSPIYKCFRFIKKIDCSFIQHYFDAHCHEYELKKIINEGARAGRFNISISNFLKIAVTIPPQIEQQKIADCLSSLDELIEAQEQKCNALKQHKKGLMQRLFPAEGENTPRWRFPEFRDSEEWDKNSLGDTCHFLSGFAFSGKDIVENPAGHRLLRGINITEGHIRHNTNIDRYIDGDVAKYDIYKIKYNDIVIGMDGSKVGKNSALVGKEDEDALLVQRVARLRPNDGYSTHFIYQYIRSEIFITYIEKINTSSGIPHISGDQIKNFIIFIPSLPEQQKIADCLSSLDDRIAAEEERLAALREHKKGLMQQLFPRYE